MGSTFYKIRLGLSVVLLMTLMTACNNDSSALKSSGQRALESQLFEGSGHLTERDLNPVYSEHTDNTTVFEANGDEEIVATNDFVVGGLPDYFEYVLGGSLDDNTVATGKVSVNGAEYYLKIVCKGDEEGSHYELCLFDDSEEINSLNIDKIEDWSQPLVFPKGFEILSKDYDKDGTPEILIGQYGCQNWNLFRMYTVTNDLRLRLKEKIPILTVSVQDFSTVLETEGNKIKYSYYDNAQVFKENGGWVNKEIEMW